MTKRSKNSARYLGEYVFLRTYLSESHIDKVIKFAKVHSVKIMFYKARIRPIFSAPIWTNPSISEHCDINSLAQYRIIVIPTINFKRQTSKTHIRSNIVTPQQKNTIALQAVASRNDLLFLILYSLDRGLSVQSI